MGGNDALAAGGRHRRDRIRLHAQLVVSMVDLGIDRSIVGDHDLDVPNWPGDIPSTAQSVGYAVYGQRQGYASAGTRP